MFSEKKFQDLFELYYVPLCYHARRFRLNPDEAEDVVQQVFIRIWENRDQIKIEKSIASYLYYSVKNQSINLLKQKLTTSKNREDYSQKLRQVELYSAITEEDGSSVLLAKELEQKIKSAIDTLPEKCREIFLLSRKENLSVKEIAEQLDVSVNTVQKQISIALSKLRDLLSHYITVLTTILCYFF